MHSLSPSGTSDMRHSWPEQDASVTRMLVVLVAALWNSSVGAQDEPVKDQFPGALLTGHFADAGTDLYTGAYSRIEVEGREYIALTYYEPYPDMPDILHVGFALLERVGEEYR